MYKVKVYYSPLNAVDYKASTLESAKEMAQHAKNNGVYAEVLINDAPQNANYEHWSSI